MQITEVISRALHEPEFRSRFLADPKAVFHELNVPIPAQQAVTVVESRQGEVFFVLPIMTDREVKHLSESIDSVHPQRSIRSRILLKVMQEPHYKAQLFKEPKAVLNAEGLAIPETAHLTLLENTPEQLYVVIPYLHIHKH